MTVIWWIIKNDYKQWFFGSCKVWKTYSPFIFPKQNEEQMQQLNCKARSQTNMTQKWKETQIFTLKRYILWLKYSDIIIWLILCKLLYFNNLAKDNEGCRQCASPPIPQVTWWCPDPQGDGMRRWAFGKHLRSWWSIHHEWARCLARRPLVS